MSANAQLQVLLGQSVDLHPDAVLKREKEIMQLTDQLQALTMAIQLQQTIVSEATRNREADCAQACGERMKNYGFRKVRIRFLGGIEITLLVRYFARNKRRAEKGKGIYFALALLGIHDKCTPALPAKSRNSQPR